MVQPVRDAACAGGKPSCLLLQSLVAACFWLLWQQACTSHLEPGALQCAAIFPAMPSSLPPYLANLMRGATSRQPCRQPAKGCSELLMPFCNSQIGGPLAESRPGRPPLHACSSASLPRCGSAEFDEEGRYERHIQAAFQAASASLLGLLQRTLGLRQTLTALKQYMLLSQGDMLGAFLDSADEELQKSAVDVSEIRLQSLLDLGEA